MKTALVVLATDDMYMEGAKVLFHSLRKHGNLPDSVTSIVIGQAKCDFAEAIPITIDYSWIPSTNKVVERFTNIANKYFALTLPFDKVILLDADILCVGDCSYLWSNNTEPLSIYAALDTAADRDAGYHYQIQSYNLNGVEIFSPGTSIHNRPNECDIVQQIRDGNCHSYDGGDQGYFNYYYQKIKPNQWGVLPSAYNQCLDPNMPQVEDKRLVHFTGDKPWASTDNNQWYNRWRDLRNEAA